MSAEKSDLFLPSQETLEALGAMELNKSSSQLETIGRTLLASDRMRNVIEPTPLEPYIELSRQTGVEVFVKREDLTAVKSFKIRGAYNTIVQLSQDERDAGIVTASAGNHAQGVAFSAQLLGLESTVVMPDQTPRSKVNAVKRLGASVELVEGGMDAAFERSQIIQNETGATYIHPFDDDEVMEGQSVIALEIIKERPETTHIFVPVGGGGLIAGITSYVKSLRPDIQVIGVEPSSSNAMGRSIDNLEMVRLDNVGIFAEGVAVRQVAKRTLDASRRADKFITVDDDEISIALADFVSEKRSVLETAGALSLAGLKKWFNDGEFGKDQVAVAITSGANIDNSHLLHVLQRAELISDNIALFRIVLPEHPGAFLDLCRRIVNSHNILKFEYRKDDDNTAAVSLGLRVSGEEDQTKVTKKLKDHGYRYADLSRNPLVREHGLQTGGNRPDFEHESFYSIEFDDRPGALLEFLEALGTSWNISMFHYGGSAGDVGRVLIGFERANRADLEELFSKHTTSYMRADHHVATMFN